MSKKSITRSSLAIDGIFQRLRSHQTPLRRSPRFPSAEKTKPEMCSSPPSIRGKRSVETCPRYLSKSLKEPVTRSVVTADGGRRCLRSRQTLLRRSPRFLLSEPMKSEISLVKSFSGEKLQETPPASLPISSKAKEMCASRESYEGICLKRRKKPSSLTLVEVTDEGQMDRRRSQRLASLSTEKMIEIPKANVEVNHGKPLEVDHRVVNSQIRRFSMRLVSITAKAGKNLTPETTVKSSPVKTRKRDCRAVTSHIKRPLTRRAASTTGEMNEEATFKVVARGKKLQDGQKTDKLKDSAKHMAEEEEIEGFNAYSGVSDSKRMREDASVKDCNMGKMRKLEKDHVVETRVEIFENTDCCDSVTWTKEQKKALEKAYILAKPSPHFWKKVSKMVPGKSAQECFDRIHSSLPTPVSRHPHPRTSRKNLSPIGSFNLSTSSSQQVPESKAGRPRRSKIRKFAVQKTLRHLLRNHSLAHQSEESDHFNLYESSPVNFAVYQLNSQSHELCLNSSDTPVPPHGENLSAGSKIHSRFKLLDSPIGPSPEVLKRIKNRALHDKYVDQLHQREQRRLMFAKKSNNTAMDRSKVDIMLEPGALQAARTVLTSEAKSFINHFKESQANCMYDLGIDDMDEYYDDDGDDNEMR